MKMLEYERIDISDGIDVDMSDKSRKGMVCHYWYFLDKNFSYGPYLCDGCYNIVQKFINLKILPLLMLKKVYTEFTFCIRVNVKQKN